MSDNLVLLTILGMGLVTYLPRVIPAWILRGKKLHPFIEAWLKYVPMAVLAALLLPSLVIAEGKLNLDWNNLYLWAALPAGLVAWKTKNMFVTILVGMAIVALARLFL